MVRNDVIAGGERGQGERCGRLRRVAMATASTSRASIFDGRLDVERRPRPDDLPDTGLIRSIAKCTRS